MMKKVSPTPEAFTTPPKAQRSSPSSAVFILRNEPFDFSKITVEEIDLSKYLGRDGEGKYVKILRNVLSPAECQRLIELSEQVGYDEALVNIGGGRQKLISDVRNNERCIIDDAELAEAMYERIRSACDGDLNLLNAAFTQREEEDDSYYVVGMNERLRFLRYDPGTYFDYHLDGSYVRGLEAGRERFNETSFVTVQIYLNEGFQGGATRFGMNSAKGFDVIPETGMVLLFEHRLWHTGALLEQGRKYAIRSDIMYTTRGPGWEYAVKPIERR